MKRYFEYIKGTSNKFWEITLKGKNVVTRYGKIGAAGRSTTKTFDTPAQAKKFTEKIISEKTKEGYKEKL